MPESGQIQELKDKVQNIISKYEERLASAGVKITVSKRYFEADVKERNTYHPDAGVRLLNDIDRHFDKKRELKYKNERNKYHCIIISVLPVDKSIVPKEYCKDYAFVIRKVERAYIGEKPQRITYKINKLLRKIEKRISKITGNAENHGVQKTCKDTFWDAIRYCFSSKYGYKSKVLGKERSFWELIFISVIGIVVLVGCLISSLFR